MEQRLIFRIFQKERGPSLFGSVDRCLVTTGPTPGQLVELSIDADTAQKISKLLELGRRSSRPTLPNDSSEPTESNN